MRCKLLSGLLKRATGPLLAILLFPWFFAACAGQVPATLPNDKDFSVPANLADQFAVRDANDPASLKPASIAAAVSAPAPAIPVEQSKAKTHGKKAKAPKKGKKMKTDVIVVPSIPEIKAGQDVPSRWTMAPVFRPGERTLFDITYFGATAGQLLLEVLSTKVVSQRPTYHFRATAYTSSVFSLFYRLNDVAESFMDTDGLYSHKYSLKLDESKQTRDVLELYDHRKNKAYYWSKLVHVQKGIKNDQSEIDLVPFTQDGLSAFHYVRTLPLEVGQVYEFPVANNGKLRTVRITVVRKEMLQTRIGEFSAIVVKPEVVLDGVLSTFGDSFIWISDDAQRTILKVDAKIKVGSVIAYLREHSYGETVNANP